MHMKFLVTAQKPEKSCLANIFIIILCINFIAVARVPVMVATRNIPAGVPMLIIIK
jgi:hypothetical protein